MMTEDSGELVPTLWGTLFIWQEEAAECAAPQEELAFNLETIALVIPDRRVVLALKRAAKAARGNDTERMLKTLAAAARSVERHLPRFTSLWRRVLKRNSRRDVDRPRGGASQWENHFSFSF
jgi:hypothetical protein